MKKYFWYIPRWFGLDQNSFVLFWTYRRTRHAISRHCTHDRRITVSLKHSVRFHDLYDSVVFYFYFQSSSATNIKVSSFIFSYFLTRKKFFCVSKLCQNIWDFTSFKMYISMDIGHKICEVSYCAIKSKVSSLLNGTNPSS